MAIVRDVEARIRALASGDESLTFAYLRKVYKELVYLERDSPAKRKRIKRAGWKAQSGKCAECGEPLSFPTRSPTGATRSRVRGREPRSHPCRVRPNPPGAQGVRLGRTLSQLSLLRFRFSCSPFFISAERFFIDSGARVRKPVGRPSPSTSSRNEVSGESRSRSSCSVSARSP